MSESKTPAVQDFLDLGHKRGYDAQEWAEWAHKILKRRAERRPGQIDYMPVSPIPEWPKRSPRFGRPFKEASAERQLFRCVTGEYNESSARIRSLLHRGGEPMVCLACGARTDERGTLPCGH